MVGARGAVLLPCPAPLFLPCASPLAWRCYGHHRTILPGAEPFTPGLDTEVPGMPYARMLFASILLGISLTMLGGCDTTDPEPEPVEIETPPPPDPALGPRPPDAALGRSAFVASCAPCHASGDGFDLAFFGFSDADIVRRGVAHVDTATARDITAFIRTLDVTPVARSFRPFQPGGQTVLHNDRDFWNRLFETSGWPSDLTAEALRLIDPTAVAVSLALPLWSSEPDESDWMPERPLPEEVLRAEAGAVQAALDRYLASPTMDGLLEVVGHFQRVTTDTTLSATPVCEGEAAVHTYPVECFEVRRWMSSLAGVHMLREAEATPVPFEVARLWWETGEAAVSHFFLTERTPLSRQDVARWLYLGFIFAPEAFPERNGYLGQFLQSSNMERLAAFAMLRRMVGDGRAHQGNFPQQYWDAFLAILRAPRELVLDVAAFSQQFLLDRGQAGLLPEDKTFASTLVRQMWETMELKGVDTSNAQAVEVAALRDELLALLEGT